MGLHHRAYCTTGLDVLKLAGGTVGHLCADLRLCRRVGARGLAFVGESMNSPSLPFAATKPPKPRKCRNRKCRAIFTPSRPLQTVCGPLCALRLIEDRAAKDKQKREKRFQQEIRERKEKAKRPQDLKAEARIAFHAYIRARDIAAGHGCIDCGKPFEPQKPGGSVDAGHYLSRGSHPNLAFSEINTNAQRKNCNRPGGTTAAAFRLGMIARYGLAAVEALEADTEPRRYRADDYRAIRDLYRAKLKELSRG